MGTDIHPAVEVRRKGVWRYHRPRTPCAYYHETYTAAEAETTNDRITTMAPRLRKGWAPVKAGDRKHRWDKCKTRLPDFFTDRDYLKFAILGNVRNGSSYYLDGEPVIPISDSRGLPHDITREARAKMSGDHSATWVTLTELLDYDIFTPHIEHGWLDQREYERVRTGQKPQSWAGGIFGPLNVTAEQYDKMQADGTLDPSKRYAIAYTWPTYLKEECPAIEQMIEYLLAIVPRGGTHDDVRIVMDFDS